MADAASSATIEATIPAIAAAATRRPLTDSVVVPNVVGRSNDEANILKILLSPSEKVVSVLPILGAGGLGKTTLAKSLYNHPVVAKHFHRRVWVCPAKKVEIVELFKLILDSMTRQKVVTDSRDAVVQEIRAALDGNRYFLVLDDVWDDEPQLWYDFFTTLEGINPANGSWCLVTTRLEQVAKTVSAHMGLENFGPYRLVGLSDDECWTILTKRIIAGEEVPQELIDIKPQILRRCGGLPLATILIGGLLLNKRKEEWQSTVEGVSSLETMLSK